MVKLSTLRLSAVLVAVTLLAACKTQKPAEPLAPSAAATATSAAAAPNLPEIVCFGDSLTAGYGTNPGESYPDALQKDLDDAGYHYRVVNEGVSGETTKDGLARVQAIIEEKPALVIVEFGGNDGLRGVPVPIMQSNLDSIVKTLTDAKLKVIMGGITLPPNYGEEYIRQFNAVYPTVAKKYKVPLMPFILQGVFGVEGSMQADQTHATAQGNKQVAKNLFPYVTPLLTH